MKIAQTIQFVALGVGLCVSATACGGDEAAQQDETETPMAAVIISSPANNQTVEGSVTIRLETQGVQVRPAGTNEPGTGHHHLFINRDITPVGEPIPTDEGVVHLGMAQTEYVLENLGAGQHTVIAVLGDYLHVRLADVATDTLRITVAGT